MTHPVISLQNVVKKYGGPAAAVAGVTFEVAPGALVALLGPSGCGKTTTLRLIAGLERPDAGTIWLDGSPAAGNGVWRPPESRRVGMVFQDGALFPHLTVAQNIAFALSAHRQSERIAELLGLVGMGGYAGRYPHQLSGGQRQRINVARALGACLGAAACCGVAGRAFFAPGCCVAGRFARRCASYSQVHRGHRHFRDPRPGGSTEHRRLGRRHVRWAGGPGRDAPGGLYAAGHTPDCHVCR